MQVGIVYDINLDLYSFIFIVFIIIIILSMVCVLHAKFENRIFPSL